MTDLMKRPLTVTPSEIDAQRSTGWGEFGPEDYCHRCGAHNIHAWNVPSDRFNSAMEALGLDSGAIVCPSCFVEGHEAATGMRCVWTLVPDGPFRHLEK